MLIRAPLWLPSACLIVLLAVGCASQPRPLLSNAGLTPASFSPRGASVGPGGSAAAKTADASGELPGVARIVYELGRPATVSIYFEDGEGRRHYFRREQSRSAGKYAVDWNGVINDPQLRSVPGGHELVEARVLPDGVYRWVIETRDDLGQRAQASGQVTVRDADSVLPDVQRFTVVPQEFSPKQDGMRGNRVSISYYLAKEARTVRVYLEKPHVEPGDPP